MGIWKNIIIFGCVLIGSPLWAASEKAQKLYDALYLDELTLTLQQEGIRNSAETAEAYLTGRAKDQFISNAAPIYDLQNMRNVLLDSFDHALSEDDMTIAIDFFTSELGAKCAELETTARVAISDPAVSDVANAAYAEAVDQNLPRIEILDQAVSDLGLVDMNLAGTMTAQYAFNIALVDVEKLNLSQSEIISMITEGQDDAQQSIYDWLMAFFIMAYTPLDDDELATYLAYQSSDNGMALNGALFDAFNQIDRDHSADLGRLMATALQSQDL